MTDEAVLRGRVREHLLRYGGLTAYTMDNLALINAATPEALHRALIEWTEPTITNALAPSMAYTKEKDPDV